MDISSASMESSTEDELISDLACECCSLKILKMTKLNDSLKRNLLKAEMHLEISNVDLKEKESELWNILERNEELKSHNIQLLGNIGFIEEKLRLKEMSNQIKNEFHLNEKLKMEEDYKKRDYNTQGDNDTKSDFTVLLKKQINDMESEIDQLKKKKSTLKQEVISIKEEASNALNDFMTLRREHCELKTKFEGVDSMCKKLRDVTNRQETRTFSLENEVTDLRGKDLQSKSKISQYHIDNAKLRNELFLTQSDRDEKKRHLEILNNSFQKNIQHVKELQSEIAKLKLQILTKNNDDIKSLQGNLSVNSSLSPKNLSICPETVYHQEKDTEFSISRIRNLEKERNGFKMNYEDERDKNREVKRQNDELLREIRNLQDERKKIEVQCNSLRVETRKLLHTIDEQRSDLQTKIAYINELTVSKLNVEAKLEKELWKNEENSRLINKNEKTIKILQSKLDSLSEKCSNDDGGDNNDQMEPKHIIIRIPQRRIRFMDNNGSKFEDKIESCQQVEEFKEIMEQFRNRMEPKKSMTTKCSCETTKIVHNLDSLVRRQQSLLRLVYSRLLEVKSDQSTN